MGCVQSCASAPGSETSLAVKLLDVKEDFFKKYDKDGNGNIDIKELGFLLKDAFPNVDIKEDEVQQVLEAFDFNKSGTVSFNELYAFLRSYNPAGSTMRRKSALIVIDVQNDFITGTLANQHNAEEIVPVINAMRDAFQLVVISYDWHPQEHCSFVESANAGNVAMKEKPTEALTPFTSVTLLADSDREEHQQMLYPRHAVQNSEGGKCHKDLVLKATDKSVYKGTKPNIDSYSAFYDNCKANDIGLKAILEKEGVTDVYCCGLVLDICVKATALHGAELGFRTVVVENACKPLMMDNVEPTREILKKAGVAIMTNEEAMVEAAKWSEECSFKEYLQLISSGNSAKQIHKGIERELSSHIGATA